MYNKFFKSEKGITGLETAIILIAFVVVAAVFAYTALSAGLFSTQKSQEAVYSGLKEAQSSLELRGGVIGIAGTTGSSGTVAQIKFVVATVVGGEPVDFTPPTDANNDGKADATSRNMVIINYQDQAQSVDNLYWTINKLGNADDDDLLEADERFEVVIPRLTAALNPDLSTRTTFNVEVITSAGAVLNIERTTPAWIDDIVNFR